MLVSIIQKAQQNDPDSMLKLISQFKPALHKYGKKLGYEDAFEDLTADFIELVGTLNTSKLDNPSDGAIIKYIHTSVYRFYLKRLHTLREKGISCISIEDLTPAQRNSLSLKLSLCENESLTRTLLPEALTSKERYVLSAIYEHGATAASIARALHVSRQNINQIKRRAEKKLKRRWF